MLLRRHQVRRWLFETTTSTFFPNTFDALKCNCCCWRHLWRHKFHEVNINFSQWSSVDHNVWSVDDLRQCENHTHYVILLRQFNSIISIIFICYSNRTNALARFDHQCGVQCAVHMIVLCLVHWVYDMTQNLCVH